MDNKKVLKNLKTISTCVSLAVMFNSGKARVNINDYQDYPVYSEIGNPKYKDLLIEMFNRMPQNVLDALERNSCHIVILDNEDSVEEVYHDIFKEYIYTRACGLTIPEYLLCFVEGCDHEGYYQKYNGRSLGLTEAEFDEILATSTLFHETGHVLDALGGFKTSRSKEFKKIYKSEVSNYINTRFFKVGELGMRKNVGDELEYFASTFACYNLFPEELLQACPETYYYLDTFIKSIDETYGSEIYERTTRR